jgi:hypothetical protein
VWQVWVVREVLSGFDGEPRGKDTS